MKKILILFSLLLLTACESIHLEPELSTDLPQTFYTPKTQIPFTLAIYPEESLHPTQVTNKTNLALCGLLYEGLFYLDESFTPHPLLVDTYSKSEDGYSWTFTLKEGITFWDSTPLTADLVVTALREAMTTSSRYFNRLQGISSINSVENTVVINLTTPNQNLPALLDVPISYGGGTLPQGTGPYLYQDGMLQLTVHKNWHGETTPHTVALLPIEKTSDLIPSFDTTQITLIDFSLTNNSSMGYSDHYEVWQYPTSTMVFLGINHKTVNDATLRSALSTAIDRTTLCSLVYAGYAVPSSLPVHPNHLNYDQSLELPYDPILSAEELAPFQGTSLTLVLPSESTEKTFFAQQLAEQLAPYDITITLVPLAWTEYQTALARSDFDLYLGEIILTPDFNISSLIHSSGNLNYGSHSNWQTDSLLALWAGATPDPTSPLTAAQFYPHIQEQGILIPLCFKDGTLLAQWEGISSATPLQSNLFYNFSAWSLPN